MNLTTCGWSLAFSWTPQLLEVGENDIQTLDDQNEILRWIDFSTNKQKNPSREESCDPCVLQLLQKDDKPCTLTISKPNANHHHSAKFNRIKIVSKARRIELSSKKQGHIGTETGQRVVEDFYQVEIKELPAKDLTLKFVSFSSRDHLELSTLEVALEESRVNPTHSMLMPAEKIDMSAVQTLLDEMDQPMSENAVRFMNQVTLLRQSKPTCPSGETDMASMMSMMAALAPSLTSQSPSNDVTPQPANHSAESNFEEKVSGIVDEKLERFEAKMMQRVDKSVSAMEGRLTGKLDMLLAALDSGQDETNDKT